jgi:hypothetical protein
MPKTKQGGAVESGNKTSPPAPPEAGPWTAEDMRAARPLPIPETEPGGTATPPAGGIPHVGAGHVKPGGRPESE